MKTAIDWILLSLALFLLIILMRGYIPVVNFFKQWKHNAQKRRKRYMKLQKRWADWLKEHPEPWPPRRLSRQ